MENVLLFLSQVRNWIWGPPLLLLLLGTGGYLTFKLRGLQFRYLGYAIKQVFSRTKSEDAGDISHFEALMTSLAGAIGTGAIVGVTTAVTVGGMGALFWMWVTAFFGMATKYAESLLAVKYREADDRGEMIGGPMKYIEKGLGWRWVAVLFAMLGSVAALGTGNLVQVNSISEAVGSVWHINPWLIGLTIAILAGFVILGGVKSIGHFAGVIVPVMALFYLGGGVFILLKHIDLIPEAFKTIMISAFHGQSLAGGFLGTSVMMTIQMGVARSVLSNEAGLGISSIAAAAAKTDTPARQALINMTGALISTLIVCTVTGLVLAVSGKLGTVTETGQLLDGAALAVAAFRSTLYWGEYIVTIGLVLFAFTTVIAWAYYGEKCFEYLFGTRSVMLYRILFTLIIIPGAAIQMELAWVFADIANGLMAIPNLIALISLSGVIVSETNAFIETQKQELAQHGMA